MRSTVWTISCSAISLASVLYLTTILFAEPPDEPKAAEKQTAEKPNTEKQNAVKPATKKSDDTKSDDTKRVSVEDARARAKLAHNIYSATLDAMHHRYFRDDRSAIPANVLETVFKEIAQQENIKARWIAVNAKAMSVNHKPQNDFEKQAAKAIAAGKTEHELIEKGIYRRAEGISLMNRGCLGCHMGFASPGKIKRFAGLVIEIPVEKP